MTFRTTLGVLVAVLLAVCLYSASDTVRAQGQGNSAGAQACQHGGWRILKKADGQPFNNQGDCVRYAAQGGVVTNAFIDTCRSFDGLVEIDAQTVTCTVSGGRDETDYLSKICTENGTASEPADGIVMCTF